MSPASKRSLGSWSSSVGFSSGRLSTARSSGRLSTSRSRVSWPSPPLYHSEKAEAFFKTTDMRHVMSDSGLVTLPRPNARIHSVPPNSIDDLDRPGSADPGQPSLLPLENTTADILGEIFPVSPQDDKLPRVSTPTENVRSRKSLRGRGSESLHRFSRKSLLPTDVSPSRKIRRHPENRPEHLVFRAKLIQKLCTLQDSWEMFLQRYGGKKKEVRHVDFMKFMDEHFRTMTRSEHQTVFDILDANHSGTVSAADFAIQCDAATRLVNDIGDLRFKLLSLGYSRMDQVLVEMEWATKRVWEPFNIGRRLDLELFGVALWTVGIETEEEHRAIFKALTRSTHSCTVSLAELRAALTTWGPPMILEDLRGQLMEKFGSLDNAFDAIDLDHDTEISPSEFAQICNKAMKFPEHDAKKAYRLIDFDGSNGLSRLEFLVALNLVEPDLHLERVRKRVRQRWRSIQAAFAWHQAGLESFDPEVLKGEPAEEEPEKEMDSDVRHRLLRQATRTSDRQRFMAGGYRPAEFVAPEDVLKNLDQYKFILSKASFEEPETAVLFNRIDISGFGKLSSGDFCKGIQVFAPSCVLEELRLHCVTKYGGVWQAFDGRSPKHKDALLNLQDLKNILEQLGFDRPRGADTVFDLVERAGGGVMVNELIVALEAATLGTHVALSPKKRDAQALNRVHQQMTPFLSQVEEHRGRVRQVITNNDLLVPRGFTSDPGSYLCSSAAWQQKHSTQSSASRNKSASLNVLPSIGETTVAESSLPEAEPLKRPPRWAMKDRELTLQLLRNATPDPYRDPGPDCAELVEEYFSSATDKLADDGEVLRKKMVSPLSQFKKLKAAGLA